MTGSCPGWRLRQLAHVHGRGAFDYGLLDLLLLATDTAFCRSLHRCSKFEPLERFVGEKKTCSYQLERLKVFKSARRKRAAEAGTTDLHELTSSAAVSSFNHKAAAKRQREAQQARGEAVGAGWGWGQGAVGGQLGVSEGR